MRGIDEDEARHKSESDNSQQVAVQSFMILEQRPQQKPERRIHQQRAEDRQYSGDQGDQWSVVSGQWSVVSGQLKKSSS